MSISKRDLKLLLYAAGILMLVAVYFLAFKPGQETIAAKRLENEQMTAQLVQLQNLEAQRETYMKETAQMQTSVQELLKNFPSEILPETAILYVRDKEKEHDITISNLGLVSDNLLYTLQNNNSAAPAGAPMEVAPVSLYSRQISCVFAAPYDTFKDVVLQIQEDKQKQNVENVTLSFDSGTGMLSGSGCF